MLNMGKVLTCLSLALVIYVEKGGKDIEELNVDVVNRFIAVITRLDIGRWLKKMEGKSRGLEHSWTTSLGLSEQSA